MALLEVEHIKKEAPDRMIIDDISFTQKALQKMAITGESGAGKSTLLKIISGNAQRDSGTVIFNGEKVTGPEEKLLAGHHDIAYLSQHYELHNNYVVKDLIWFQINVEEAEAAKLFEICRIRPFAGAKDEPAFGWRKATHCFMYVAGETTEIIGFGRTFFQS